MNNSKISIFQESVRKLEHEPLTNNNNIELSKDIAKIMKYLVNNSDNINDIKNLLNKKKNPKNHDFIEQPYPSPQKGGVYDDYYIHFTIENN